MATLLTYGITKCFDLARIICEIKNNKNKKIYFKAFNTLFMDGPLFKH